MTDTNIDIMPKLSDILAAAVAAGSAMAFTGQGSPAVAATEQFIAQIAGRVTANYFSLTDNLHSEGGTVTEQDVHVGLLRGGYSLSLRRKNNRVLMDAAKGLICSVAGKQIDQQFVNKTA